MAAMQQVRDHRGLLRLVYDVTRKKLVSTKTKMKLATRLADFYEDSTVEGDVPDRRLELDLPPLRFLNYLHLEDML